MFPYVELLALSLIIILVCVVWFFARKKKSEKVAGELSKAVAEISIEISPTPESDSQAKQIWTEILQKRGYLKPLTRKGSMLILGSPSMGADSVLKYIVRQANTDQNDERQMAIYIDLEQFVPQLGPFETMLPEQVFRSIVSCTTDTYLEKIEEKIGKAAYKNSGLDEIDRLLKEQLDNSIIEMPVIEIGKTLNTLWEKLGISYVKIGVNGISNVKPVYQPYLFNLLVRTFQKSGCMDLLVVGELDKLTLINDTPESQIGVQYGHDIFLGFNLAEVINPSIEISSEASINDVRYEFITNIIQRVCNEFDWGENTRGTGDIFSSDSSWKLIFPACNFDINCIMEMTLKIGLDFNIDQSSMDEDRVKKIILR